MLSSVVSVYSDLTILMKGFILLLISISVLISKEKAPYEAKAARRKAEYEKLMNAYNTKQVST